MAALSCYRQRFVTNKNFILYEGFTGATPATSFDTYSIYVELPPLCDDGVKDLATSETGIWNCQLCGNDKAYFQPAWGCMDENNYLNFFFKEHDYISADWKNPTAGWYGTGAAQILCKAYYNDGCSGAWTLIDVAAASHKAWAAVDVDERFNYQVIQLVNYIYTIDQCMKFKFEFFNGGVNPYITYYSDCFFATEEPPCQAYLKIEGTYNDLDCEGYYYGIPKVAVGEYDSLATAKYKNIVGVWGKLSLVGNDYEAQKNEFGELTANKVAKVSEIKGSPIPPYVAKQLARAFASDEVLVNENGKQYTLKDGSFNKGITDSNMWRLKAQLIESKCQLFFGCE